MADFIQMMKDWRRMCMCYRTNDNPDCSDCPMVNNRLCGFEISDIQDEELEDAQQTITTWVAEHPEPVYPTWVDWLMEQGIIPDFETAKNSDEPGVRAASFYITKKGFIPIPADIAEKLGIEPKRSTLTFLGVGKNDSK